MSEQQASKERVSPIVFYCKDCGVLVKPTKCGNKYVYKAPCGTKNVAFGTKKSIASFFHLKEEELVVQNDVCAANKSNGRKRPARDDKKSRGQKKPVGMGKK